MREVWFVIFDDGCARQVSKQVFDGFGYGRWPLWPSRPCPAHGGFGVN